MARKPRIHIDGGLYHVMLRGNGGHDIFFDDADHHHLYGLLQEGVERYGYRIHGYCCMTNHLHLALQVGEVELSSVMQNIAFRYTRWINQRQKRTGHLFQGRYKAVLVDGDNYLLELVRYIHLNPVRARLVKDAAAYRWSSHRAYLGQEVLPWLTTDVVLSHFAATLGVARNRYQRFVLQGVGEGYREDFHRGASDSRVLAGDRFMKRVLNRPVPDHGKPPSLTAIVRQVCKEYDVKESELNSNSRIRHLTEARGVVGWLAYECKSATLTQVAERFGRDVSAMSVAVRRIAEKRLADKRVGVVLQVLMKRVWESNNSIPQA